MADQPGDKPHYQHDRLSRHLGEIDLEIARLASICKVPLLDPGVIERVLHNDPTVCGSSNARAFDKLRQLLMMHYTVRDRVVGTLGEPETQQIVREIVEQLRHRIGDKLGGAGRV